MNALGIVIWFKPDNLEYYLLNLASPMGEKKEKAIHICLVP